MLKTTLLAILISIFTISVATAQDQNPYKKVREKQLIKNLSDMDSGIRYYSAQEIKRRLTTNEVVIKEGNIIEHTRDYWENKTKHFQKMTDIRILLDTMEILTNNLTPNYDNIKRFNLDHFFGITVQMNKRRTKGKIVSLNLDPYHYRIEPPKNYTGLWKRYSVTGNLSMETAYKEGEIDGFETIYRQDGSVVWAKLYINGEIQFQRNYSEIGEMKSEQIFDEKSRQQYEKELEYELNFMKKLQSIDNKNNNK